MNPVLWLDLRIRIAERKLWIVAILFVITLLLGASISLRMIYNLTSFMTEGPASLGSAILYFVLVLHAGLMALISPLSTAGRISQEREQRTLPSLLNSPASAISIIFGKLVGAWVFLIWVSFLALPFLAVGLLWGGLSWETVLACFLSNTACALMFSTIALGFSAFCGRTLTAYLLTGTFLFAWTAVLPLFFTLFGTSGSANKTMQFLSTVLLYHNPFYPLFYFFGMHSGESSTPHVLTASAIVFCYAVWAAVSVCSVAVAMRGLKREAI